MFKEYDIIVVGGGHAGCEAASSAAKLGSSVLLVTMSLNALAQMSCNPSMGGIAKGQILREIDALGGLSGIITDRTMIQFRMLNRSKGPAMWSPRAQNDRYRFSREWRIELEGISNLDFWQDTVNGILVKGDKACGVKTALGLEIKSKAVIITAGTFLNGIIHIGEVKMEGGRIGDFSAKGLTESLRTFGFSSKRLKTGTPVRVDGRTIDFTKLIEQKGDDKPGRFSYMDTPELTDQRSCWLAHTNEKVHDILRTGFDKSPMFQGRIEGVGPRYCPSIEDKIERFSHKNSHQLFIEPEGKDTVEYYVNGFSSSLPDYIQFEALRNIEGFEKAKIFRSGYAIEYDYFPPEQLKQNLETKTIGHLFFAGQINGTTGYEEAAGQGLMAGINAHLTISGQPEFVLKRQEAYIGVLIDDLITKGIDEPYRMFTSRAEYRILLRQDNADVRLTHKGFELGLAEKDRMDKCTAKRNAVDELVEFLKSEQVSPDEINGLLVSNGTPEIVQRARIANLVLRPQVLLNDIVLYLGKLGTFVRNHPDINSEVIEEAEILIKYRSYIEKEKEVAEKLTRLEDIELYEEFDFKKIKSLSIEAREKLSKIRPRTIGQASRISGVSPADVSVLLVYLGR